MFDWTSEFVESEIPRFFWLLKKLNDVSNELLCRFSKLAVYCPIENDDTNEVSNLNSSLSLEN